MITQNFKRKSLSLFLSVLMVFGLTSGFVPGFGAEIVPAAFAAPGDPGSVENPFPYDKENELDFPPYPQPGGVQLAKTADWTDYENYREAEVVLTVSGQPMPQGVDVVLVLDVSGSMGSGSNGNTFTVNRDIVSGLVTFEKAAAYEGRNGTSGGWTKITDTVKITFTAYLDKSTGMLVGAGGFTSSGTNASSLPGYSSYRYMRYNGLPTGNGNDLGSTNNANRQISNGAKDFYADVFAGDVAVFTSGGVTYSVAIPGNLKGLPASVSSGSYSSSRWQQAQIASDKFLEMLFAPVTYVDAAGTAQRIESDNRVAVVTFGSSASTLAGLSGAGSKSAIERAINDIAISNTATTNYGAALDQARSIVTGRDAAYADRPIYVVFMSDGTPTSGVLGTNVAYSASTSGNAGTINTARANLHNALNAANAKNGVYTVGYMIGGSTTSDAYRWLDSIKKAPGTLTNINSAAGIISTFEEIAGAIIEAGTDAVVTDYIGSVNNPKDGDGIPYYFHVDINSFSINGAPCPLTLDINDGKYKSADGKTIIVDVGEPDSVVWNLDKILKGDSTLKYKATLDEDAPNGIYYSNGAETNIRYKNYRGQYAQRAFEVPQLTKPGNSVRVVYFAANAAGNAISATGTQLHLDNGRVNTIGNILGSSEAEILYSFYLDVNGRRIPNPTDQDDLSLAGTIPIEVDDNWNDGHFDYGRVLTNAALLVYNTEDSSYITPGNDPSSNPFTVVLPAASKFGFIILVGYQPELDLSVTDIYGSVEVERDGIVTPSVNGSIAGQNEKPEAGYEFDRVEVIVRSLGGGVRALDKANYITYTDKDGNPIIMITGDSVTGNMPFGNVEINYYYTQATKDIAVKKIWDDDSDDYRDGVAIRLLYLDNDNEIQLFGELTLDGSEADPWTGKFEDVPVYRAPGNLYEYKVVEVSVPTGYVASYDPGDFDLPDIDGYITINAFNEETGAFIVTNTIRDDLTVTYYRNWSNADDASYVDEGLTFGSRYTALAFGTPAGFAAPAGYHFAGWYGDAAGTGAAITVIDPLGYGEDLYAKYEEDGNITIYYEAATGGYVSEPINGGNVLQSSESLPPATGTALGSAATAAFGYRFLNWTRDGVEVSADFGFIPSKNADGIYEAATYVANFEIDGSQTYTINYISNGNGGVDPASETHQVLFAGDNSGSTATAAFGYRFLNWTSDAAGLIEVSDSVNYIPTIHADATFYANFEIDGSQTYTINYVSNGNGGVDPASETHQVLFAGDNSGSTATAAFGYRFLNWTDASGAEVSDSANYIPAIHADATFYANFEIDGSQTKTLSYTVAYYRNGNLYETLPAVRETVWVNAPNVLDVRDVDTSADRYDGFRFSYTEPGTVPEIIADGEIIRVYYISLEGDLTIHKVLLDVNGLIVAEDNPAFPDFTIRLEDPNNEEAPVSTQPIRNAGAIVFPIADVSDVDQVKVSEIQIPENYELVEILPIHWDGGRGVTTVINRIKGDPILEGPGMLRVVKYIVYQGMLYMDQEEVGGKPFDVTITPQTEEYDEETGTIIVDIEGILTIIDNLTESMEGIDEDALGVSIVTILTGGEFDETEETIFFDAVFEKGGLALDTAYHLEIQIRDAEGNMLEVLYGEDVEFRTGSGSVYTLTYTAGDYAPIQTRSASAPLIFDEEETDGEHRGGGAAGDQGGEAIENLTDEAAENPDKATAGDQDGETAESQDGGEDTIVKSLTVIRQIYQLSAGYLSDLIGSIYTGIFNGEYSGDIVIGYRSATADQGTVYANDPEGLEFANLTDGVVYTVREATENLVDFSLYGMKLGDEERQMTDTNGNRVTFLDVEVSEAGALVVIFNEFNKAPRYTLTVNYYANGRLVSKDLYGGETWGFLAGDSYEVAYPATIAVDRLVYAFDRSTGALEGSFEEGDVTVNLYYTRNNPVEEEDTGSTTPTSDTPAPPVTIPDTPTPLAPMDPLPEIILPRDTDIIIEDEESPLGNLPKTGTAGVSGLGLIGLGLSGLFGLIATKKKQEDK